MNSALGFQEVISLGYSYDWRFPLVWTLSANLNAKFRVRGPWATDSAKAAMTGEMWTMIKRRRLFFGQSFMSRGTEDIADDHADHFLLSIMPMMIFGPVMLLVYLYSSLVLAAQMGGNRIRTIASMPAQEKRHLRGVRRTAGVVSL